MKSLVELFDKYGCDKGNIKHRYDRVYEPVLVKYGDESFRMLEIGIFKGNSTEAFIEYCPNLEIVAVDIFTRIKMEDVSILNHPRVHGCKCNSLKGPNNEFFEYNNGGYDIIIDDGLHTHRAQWQTFENFIPYLKDGGSYFIEDVWAYDRMAEKDKQHQWLKKHGQDFSEDEYQKLLDVIEPYEVTYHDLREGYDPDTFILEIKK